MILTERIAHAVAAGEVTLAFRRWTTLRLRPGATLRTVAGTVRIEAIELVPLADLDDHAARLAGYNDREELVATLRGEDSDPVYRVTLTWVGLDPRDALAANTALSDSDIAELDALIDRLDETTPWARATLCRIGGEPGVTARAIAAEVGIDKDTLKRRIRVLKEHGLTHSLRIGYALSPRGTTYLNTSSSFERHFS